jgi:hypothetical protein
MATQTGGVQIIAGTPGPAMELTIGTVVTGPAGATLTTIGTAKQRLDLSLPPAPQDLVYKVSEQPGATDTVKAQAALDKCRDAGGGEVLVDLRTFGQAWEMGKLTIYRNTTFRMMPGAVIKRKGVSFGLVNYKTGTNPLADNADPYSGHGNIKVIGGTWDGNVITEGYLPGGYDLTYFVAARGLVFEDVTFKDVVTNHVLDLNGVADVSVRRCNFLGYKDGTTDQSRGYAEAIQYTQNIDETIPGAEFMLGTPSTNITVEHSVFGASGTPGTQAWPAAFGNHSASNDKLCNDIKIHHNTFNGMTFGAVVPYTYDDVKIHHNTFRGCAFGVKANNFTNGKTWDAVNKVMITGGPTRQETHGMSITDNHFWDTITTDVSILGTDVDANGFWATCNDLTITGNKFLSTLPSGTAPKRTGQNIRLLLCNNGTVSLNRCKNAAENILVDSCVDIDVAVNQTKGSTGYGIRCVKLVTPPGTDAKYASNNRIMNNTVRNSGSHGIGANSIYDFQITGNCVLDWGSVTASANGILASGSDTGYVDGNTVKSLTAGLGTGINITGSTNVAVTVTNRVSKPDGGKVFYTGSGNTYGELNYVAPVWTNMTLDAAAVVGFNAPQATLTEGGRKVELNGSFNIPGTYASAMLVATLPAGMFPLTGKRLLAGVDDNAGGRTLVYINTLGQLKIYGNPGVAKNVILDGLQFFI